MTGETAGAAAFCIGFLKTFGVMVVVGVVEVAEGLDVVVIGCATLAAGGGGGGGAGTNGFVMGTMGGGAPLLESNESRE